MNRVLEIADIADRISALKHDLKLVESDLDDLYLIGYSRGLNVEIIDHLLGLTGLIHHHDVVDYLNRLSDEQIKRFFITD